MKVLVVEDERKLGQFIKKGLEEVAYTPVWVRTCEEARNAVCETDFEVIILDLGLPDGNGLDLLQEWRHRQSEARIIILSARAAVEDRIAGLNLGADDYVPKPFSFEELLARIRSLSRRQLSQKNTVLEHDSLRMDLVTREVTQAGENLTLSPREFALLEMFLRNVNRVMTRTQIAEKIWDCHFDMETNLIDVYVGKLRGKLKLKTADSDHSSMITTVRGVGYVLK